MGWSRQGSGAKLGRTKHQLKRKKEGFKQSNSQRCDARFPKARTRFPNGQCSPPAGVPARRVLRSSRHDKRADCRTSRSCESGNHEAKSASDHLSWIPGFLIQFLGERGRSERTRAVSEFQLSRLATATSSIGQERGKNCGRGVNLETMKPRVLL